MCPVIFHSHEPTTVTTNKCIHQSTIRTIAITLILIFVRFIQMLLFYLVSTLSLFVPLFYPLPSMCLHFFVLEDPFSSATSSPSSFLSFQLKSIYSTKSKSSVVLFISNRLLLPLDDNHKHQSNVPLTLNAMHESIE